MVQIIADFTALWRSQAQPADLDVDASYWLFIRNSYSGLAALRGIDLWVQNPFNTAEGAPITVPDATMLTWVNGNVWRGECPGCSTLRSACAATERQPSASTAGAWSLVAIPSAGSTWNGHRTWRQAERQLLKRPNPQHREIGTGN